MLSLVCPSLGCETALSETEDLAATVSERYYVPGAGPITGTQQTVLNKQM